MRLSLRPALLLPLPLTCHLPPPRLQRPASCFWELVGQMVTEHRKRGRPEAVEACRAAALAAVDELGAALEPLWQQLRCANSKLRGLSVQTD